MTLYINSLGECSHFLPYQKIVVGPVNFKIGCFVFKGVPDLVVAKWVASVLFIHNRRPLKEISSD